MQLNGTSSAGTHFLYRHRGTWEIGVFYVAPTFLLLTAVRALLAGESGCRRSLVVTCLGVRIGGAFSSIHVDSEQKSGKGKMLRQGGQTLQNLCRLQTALFLSIKEFSRPIFYVCGYISRCIKILCLFSIKVFHDLNILKILGFTFSWTGLFRETKEGAWQDYGVASIHFLYSCG